MSECAQTGHLQAVSWPHVSCDWLHCAVNTASLRFPTRKMEMRTPVLCVSQSHDWNPLRQWTGRHFVNHNL